MPREKYPDLMPFWEWSFESDQADRRRREAGPPPRLPGVRDGLDALRRARALLATPDAPGALDDARRAVAEALAAIPASTIASPCREYRWRDGIAPDAEAVCLDRTCGRCAPLRAAAE